jgi:hypothetical protein
MKTGVDRQAMCLLAFAVWMAGGIGMPAFAAETLSASPAMPFSFVQNKGQTDPDIRYIGNGPHFKAWFRDDEVTLQQGDAVTRVRFEGARPHPRIEANDPLGAKANYLRGTDRSRWQTDLPLFGSIIYRGVWEGIGIRFRAEDSRTKAEYVVDPGASVETIRLRFEGTPRIEPDGSLVVANESGEFREEKPLLFQGEGATRKEVAGSFRRFADGWIGFSTAAYDRTQPLVVDPTIVFSGYFGGASQSTITSVAVNSYYNIIVAGWTVGTDLPASGGVRQHNSGGVDAFIAGFSPAGGSLVFCTYLGGSSDDRAFGVAVDSSNNTYVTGWTSSTNFPVQSALQARLKGTRDAFIAKLNPAGNALIYSTYLGGSGVDTGNAIAVDGTNSVFIIGDTSSTNLPVSVGAFQSALGGSQDAFVAKLSPDGSSLRLMTYFGGSAAEHGAAIKVDTSGSAYISGSTYSTDLPVLLGSQPHSGGGQDGFVARLTPSGASLVFSTYLGGSGGSPGAPEVVNAISLAADNLFMVAGTTSSPDFPVTPPVLQSVFGGGQTDGFFSRLDPATGALQRSTFLGGSGDDGINAMVTDAYSSFQYVAGYTSSADFPAVNAVQGRISGGLDAFLAKVGFSAVISATYLGGGANDSANALAVDSLTNVVVVGSTASGNYPTVIRTATGPGKSQFSSLTSFITKISPSYSLAVANMPSILIDVWHNTGYNGPNLTLNFARFGAPGDVPVVGDWDGSGVKRLGVFRNGTWILDLNGNGVIDSSDKTISFGSAGDVPVVGDWNGTGGIKLGLFRQGVFILDRSGHLSGTPTGLADSVISFGLPGDIPVVADWNSSGTTKLGVFRNGQWLVDTGGANTITATYLFGQAGDLPVVGDWKGTGVANQIGIYRSGSWILNVLGNNRMAGYEALQMYLGFGGPGYKPLVF